MTIKNKGRDDRWIGIQDDLTRAILRDLLSRLDALDVTGVGTTVPDRSITSAKLALAAVIAANIANGAVGTAQLADGGVTAGKLAAGAVPVQSVAGRTGAVTLAAADVSGVATTGTNTYSGNQTLGTAGNKLLIKEGSNASMGLAVLTGGTVTVANTLVTSASRIFLTTNAPGGAVGSPYVSARVAGTSFTITSTSATDTSSVAWRIVEPA